MATNFRRLGGAVSLAGLAFVATFLALAPVQAEPPKTALEWFNLIHQRNADIYGVRMESTWQRFENGKLVEEWDQIVETDDLGGIRLEELGRTSRGQKADDPITVTDTIYAFDGSEYRELTKTWVARSNEPLTASRKAVLRAEPPRSVFGSIEAEPGGPSGLRRTPTPMRMADHWFLECLSNTLAEALPFQVTPREGRLGLWEVVVDSQDDTFGHKCRAVVDETKDLRVVELDMWDAGRWAARYDVGYSQRNGRWQTSHGSFASVALTDADAGRPPHEYEYRFNVHATEVFPAGAEPLEMVDFPAGARVIDGRTDALYTVGRESVADAELARLVEQGRRILDAERTGEPRAGLGPARVRIWTNWFAAGALAGFAAFGVPDLIRRARAWRRTQTGAKQLFGDSRPRSRPSRFRFPRKPFGRS